MFYHQKVARVRVFADIQNFALRARHSPLVQEIFLLHTWNYHFSHSSGHQDTDISAILQRKPQPQRIDLHAKKNPDPIPKGSLDRWWSMDRGHVTVHPHPISGQGKTWTALGIAPDGPDAQYHTSRIVGQFREWTFPTQVTFDFRWKMHATGFVACITRVCHAFGCILSDICQHHPLRQKEHLKIGHSWLAVEKQKKEKERCIRQSAYMANNWTVER